VETSGKHFGKLEHVGRILQEGIVLQTRNSNHVASEIGWLNL